MGQHAADWIDEHLTTLDGAPVELEPWQEAAVNALRSGERMIVRPPSRQGYAFLRDVMIAEVKETPGAVVVTVDAARAAELKQRYGLRDDQVVVPPGAPHLGSRDGAPA